MGTLEGAARTNAAPGNGAVFALIAPAVICRGPLTIRALLRGRIVQAHSTGAIGDRKS